MRIALLAPPQWLAYGRRRLPVYPPLGLLQLASCLEAQGNQVTFADADADGITIWDVLGSVKRKRVDVVGITATTPSFPIARRWAARVRSLGCPVLIGGPHASALPEEVASTSCFDAVVVGEAEATVGQVLGSLGSGLGEPGLVVSPSSPLGGLALDDLPPPAWHLVRHPSRYLPPDASSLPVGTVMLSRGCPFSCPFCQSSSLFGTRVRYVSPKKAVELTWHVHETIGAREIHIIDDCFTANRARALEILDALAESGPPVRYAFGNGVRADLLDEDLLDAMAAAGVYAFGLGLETGDESLAAHVGKDCDVARLRALISHAHRRGMSVWGFFMLGLPGETPHTLERTRRMASLLPLDVVKYEIFKPFPGTPLWDVLRERGALLPKPWEAWGIHTPPVHTGELSPRALWRARRKEVVRTMLSPRAWRGGLRTRPSLTRVYLNLRAALYLASTVVRPW